MEYFTLEGTWWLPDSPDHCMPGALTFDADGLGLAVDGSLVPTVAVPGAVLRQEAPSWATTPVILGRARDGRRVTLLEAGGANLIGPKISRTTYRVRFALVGVHTTADRFSEAWCEFDCLNAWTYPPSLVEDAGEADSLTVRFKSLDLAQAQIGEAKVRLVARVVGTAGGDIVDVKQRATFAVDVPPTGAQSILREWVRPLQDLLMLTLGRSVRLTALHLRPDGADQDDDLAEVSFEAIQPTTGRAPDWTTVASYTAPTLVQFNDSPVPFGDLLPRWFRLRSDQLEVIVLLHGPYYAPFMFSEHRYASTFQSAEALADACDLSGREKTRAEHRARVTAIISTARTGGVDEESLGWAQRILQSRNDKPLWRQIQDLASSTGKIGNQILVACPTFGQITAGARTGVSHGGADGGLDAVGRQWHGEVLRWVIRAKLLMQLGVDASEVERRVLQRAGFQYALDQIRAPSEEAQDGQGAP